MLDPLIFDFLAHGACHQARRTLVVTLEQTSSPATSSHPTSLASETPKTVALELWPISRTPQVEMELELEVEAEAE